MANLFSIAGEMLRVEGFLCFAFAERFPQALREIGTWVEEGRLKFREHVGDGVETAPRLFTTLFSGANEGRPSYASIIRPDASGGDPVMKA